MERDVMVHNSRKVLALLTSVGLGLGIAACSSSQSTDTSDTSAAQAASTITVEDNYGSVEIAVPVDKVVALDNRSFQILDQWGVDLVAAPIGLIPDTIPNYKNNTNIVDLGSHREPDLEALTAAAPDLIINGQRFSQHYEDIKKLNPNTPMVDFEPREEKNLDEELKRQVTALGEIFGKQEEAKKINDDFDAALNRAKKAYNGSDKVMAVNVSSGEIGYIGPGVGRTFGPVFDMLELTPALEVKDSSSNHEGDDISVEAIAQSNPDWIFVLDRDAAVAEKGETVVPAKEIISDSAPLKNTKALKEDHVVYAPADTYTNESIITYTVILNEIADAFESAQ